MALPLVDFIHTDDVPVVSRQLSAGSERVSMKVRTLNAAADGPRTLVVDCPAPARLPRGYWACDLEILVLRGAFELDGQPVERYGYLFVPAGVAVGPLAVTSGDARLLVFASGRPVLTAADGDAPGAARHRMVGPVHVGDVPWEQPKTAGFPAGAGRKTLRDDREAGESFWILGLLPHWSSPLLEWHTFAEENVILEGEIQTAVGLMRPGSYLAHPPGEHTVHGPMRSRTGALLITRAVGPFETTYESATGELDGPWR